MVLGTHSGIACSRPVYCIQSGHLSLCKLHLSLRHAAVCMTQAMWVSFGETVLSFQPQSLREIGGVEDLGTGNFAADREERQTDAWEISMSSWIFHSSEVQHSKMK